VEQYKTNITLHLRQAYEIVKKNLEEYAISTKVLWDSKVVAHESFVVGQQVMMYLPKTSSAVNDPARSHQFKSSWQGPFDIVSQKYSENEDVYMIKDSKTGREWTVNVHKLKRFHDRPFLNSVHPLVKQKAPRKDSMRFDVNIPVVDRLRDIEGCANTVSSNGLANLDDECVTASDASDEVVSLPEVSLAKPDVSQGPSPSLRHLTGVTVQEQGRKAKRDRDLAPEPNLSQLQEFEVKRIIQHKRQGRRNNISYEVEWVSEHPNTWQTRDTFNQTEILQEYWDLKSSKDTPREFKKQNQVAQNKDKRQKTSLRSSKVLRKSVRFSLPPPL